MRLIQSVTALLRLLPLRILAPLQLQRPRPKGCLHLPLPQLPLPAVMSKLPREDGFHFSLSGSSPPAQAFCPFMEVPFPIR